MYLPTNHQRVLQEKSKVLLEENKQVNYIRVCVCVCIIFLIYNIYSVSIIHTTSIMYNYVYYIKHYTYIYYM